MANFPVIESIAMTGSSAGYTSLDFNIPGDLVVGELLIAVISLSTGTITGPAGWTLVTSEFKRAIYKRIVDGSEGATADFNSNQTAGQASACYRISNWTGDLDDIEIAKVAQSGTEPNPPSLSPSFGFADTLWLASVLGSDARSGAVTSPPTNYNTDGYSTGTGSSYYCQLGTASLEKAATTEDPGNFVMSVSDTSWLATTIGIKGAVLEGRARMEMLGCC